jgi:hypothetical protein
MKEISQLIHTEDPAWQIVQPWLQGAVNHCEILPKDAAQAATALVEAQVSTKSTLGAIIYETGGVLVNHGRIRILGSGSALLQRSVMQWNKGKTFTNIGEPPSHLLVADDILGGYFAINAGGIGTVQEQVYYLAQDTLEWESLDIGYSDFLYWTLYGDVEGFYETFTWKQWLTDVKELNGNQVFSFYPFLWSMQGKSMEDIDKKIVSIEEHYALTQEFMKQIYNKKI